jgi:trehalose 6-phosphate synthase
MLLPGYKRGGRPRNQGRVALARLVVVSNRVPSESAKPVAGGLAVAMQAALHDNGGLWFGFSGDTVRGEPGPIEVAERDGITYATTDLNANSYRDYYEGYANQTLWPLFHYRVDLTVFDRATFAGYHGVNKLFAERLMPLLKDGDIIWVQDYHLIPLGEELRRLGCDRQLGFFLHTPFPAPEILATLYNHRRLVRAMLAYDLIGFQSPSDLRSFQDYVTRVLPDGRLEPDGTLSAYGLSVRAGAFPIGIEPQSFAELATTRDALRYGQRVRESLRRHLILSVDRLDYSKGLPQRVAGLSYMLEHYPEHRRRVVFMQIASPSRTEVPQYQEIRQELNAAVGQINGRFGRFDWVPVRYINRTYSHSVLAGLYRFAHVCLVTPLRDGMNLVAKEYVAAQDPADPGVLVLSKFAGAAHQMDGALIVNPYDAQAMGNAVHRGLIMAPEERMERWQTMMDRISSESLTWWRESFITALASVSSANNPVHEPVSGAL